ncbi:MAG: phage integrase N-terminal SAM-like domain-containing protein [Candidatus Bathyarchaeia archaeon]
MKTKNELLERFKDFQMVDLRRAKRTAYEKVWFIKRLLKDIDKQPTEITREDLRSYLRSLEKYSSATYENALMPMKVFFRDFLEKPEVVASFNFPHQVFKPKHIMSNEQVKQFCTYRETPKEEALFMLYVSTGLRRKEILSLKLEDIDFERRMITPNNHLGFYNQEAELTLREYLATKKPSRSQGLFPMKTLEVKEL